jgi:arabinose-5-phosphate isomerase
MSEQPRTYDVAGTGSMVVDTIYRAPELLGPEQKGLLAPHPGGPIALRFVGGVTLNHLGWAAVLGLRTAVFGKQADDAEGRFLRAGMARLGIDARLDLSGSHSSFAQVYVDPTGERAIYMSRGATGELHPAEIDLRHAAVIDAARIVTTEISQVPLAVARRVLERARKAGALTVVDLDVPLGAARGLGSEEDFHALLALADVLKPSRAAARGLGDDRSPGALARSLAERYGARWVALTLGAEGALLLAEGREHRTAAARIEPVDTTGAGDAFLGGLLAALHYGLDPDQAVRLGCAAGAACCERLGAFPDDAVRSRARVLELHAEIGGRPFAARPLAVGPADDPLARFVEIAPQEVLRAAEALPQERVRAAAALIEQVESSGGRVHLTGVGKPEHVARYAAALLSSTGTPATFLHATEAVHGSVGQLREGDLLIAISNSGETPELLACLEAARSVGARLLAVTGAPRSSLARAAELCLPAAVEREGGPLGLAPRTSVLAQVLVLAALSVELEARKKQGVAEYHRRHPAGSLGRRTRP